MGSSKVGAWFLCEEAVRDPIVVFVISSIKEDVELLLLRN